MNSKLTLEHYCTVWLFEKCYFSALKNIISVYEYYFCFIIIPRFKYSHQT